MSNFETMFDNLDVNANLMDQVMDNVNAGSYQEQDVSGLINQVAQEFGMKVGEEFASPSMSIKDGQQQVNQPGSVNVNANANLK